MVFGKPLASLWRFGRGILDLAELDRQLGLARGPPGPEAAASSTVIAPASSQASILENKVVPSARRRS